MKHQNFRSAGLSRWLRSSAILGSILLSVHADPLNPEWWTTRKVLKPDTSALDYSAINQGQLKNMAIGAYEHLRTAGAPLGGLGDMISESGEGRQLRDLVSHWVVLDPVTNAPLQQVLDINGNPILGGDHQPIYASGGTGKYKLYPASLSHTDYRMVNLGTLKAVARPFYNRLNTLYANAGGYPKPWTDDGDPLTTTDTEDDESFAAANAGQLKNVFGFNLLRDADQDGLSDIAELAYGVDALNPDANGDGKPDYLQILSNRDPNQQDNPAVGLSVSGFVSP